MVFPSPEIPNLASKSNKAIKIAGAKKLQKKACPGRAARRACLRIFALSMRINAENSLNLQFIFFFTVEENKKMPKAQKQIANISENL